MNDKNYDDSWRSAPVDPKVRGLVEALNSVPGVRTNSSCSGHVFRNAAPYVAFEAPVEFAGALARKLREDAHSPFPKLKAQSWSIIGLFDSDGRFFFRLGEGEFFVSGSYRKWQIINNDHQIIKEFVQEISTTEGGAIMETKTPNYPDEAAHAIYMDLADNPLEGVPVDPDVAECMGCFDDDAMSEEDVLESRIGVDENGVAVGEEGGED